MQRLSVGASAGVGVQSRSFEVVPTDQQPQQNSVANSELNLHSVSSDSGLHTEKTSEMSSGDFTSKMEDDQSSPTTEMEKETAPNCDNTNKPSTPVRLSRVGSVKSRVNIFQHLDNKQNTTAPPVLETKRPTPKKRKSCLELDSWPLLFICIREVDCS